MRLCQFLQILQKDVAETNRKNLLGLNISSGSATELDYLFLLAKDLNFISEEDYLNLNEDLIEIIKMLFALIQKIASTLN